MYNSDNTTISSISDLVYCKQYNINIQISAYRVY